jgi:hypothetical protein
MTIRLFVPLLFIAALFASPKSPLYPDVTVLTSDAKGITLEFRPQYQSDRTVKSERATYAVPRFSFELPAASNQPGSEDLRSRVVLMATPSSSGNRVTVLAADHAVTTSYDLAPVPMITAGTDPSAPLRQYRAAYRSVSTFVPEQIATFSYTGMVKGIPTGTLTIAPFQYNAASRSLRKYSRIVVRIDFGEQNVSADLSGNNDWANASLVNYPQLKLWSRNTVPSRQTAVSSVLSSGTWAKVEVTEDAIYRLDASYLRTLGMDPVGRSITDVKVFGGNGQVIPENLATPRPADLPQVAVEYVDKNGNGTFDADDHILFYGQGVNGWTYNATQKRFNHYGNPYTFSNYYFVALGASAPVRRITAVAAPGTTAASLTTARGKMVFDEDKFNFNQSGQDWVSSPINSGETRTVSTKLTGWVPGTSVTYQYYVYGRATDRTTMSIEESGQVLATTNFLPVDFASYDYFAWPTAGEATIVPGLSDGRSAVKFKYNSTSTISTSYIGWLRLLYTQQLTAINDQITFASPDSSGTVEYRVNGFSRNDVTAYEISDVQNVRSMNYTLAMEAGVLTFKDTLRTGVIRRYMLCTPDQYRTPRSFVKVPNSDLHALTGAEFIIITHSDFKADAVRLKQHKESLPGAKKITTVVVDVDTIYNEFGNGMPDPTALRDFLRYAREQWTVTPKYVLLFGDASYDFRSILQNDRSWVPTYETAESNTKISTFAIEDYFTYIDPAAPFTVSIALGRLTPRSAADAKTVVDKIIHYETGMSKGPWKNTATLVADDMWAPGSEFESEHIYQTEVIAGITNGKGFNVERIYMEEFETVFASTGRRKPTARAKILDMVNKSGTLLLNYVGHGNPKVWAHESILTQDDVRNQFVNADKLMFITAATCDWGRFEEAGESSSAEDVVLSRKGGAIGVISANRAVYSNENALLNQRFYQYLFSGNPVLRMGDAYVVMKNSLGFSDNNQKYFLLVDPTIALSAPQGTITVDSLVNASGRSVDSLMALERITVKASVRDTANALVTGFNGTAVIEVHDAEFTTSVPAVPGFAYTEKGSVIYSGQASVVNGTMSASFVVPKDIAYTNRSGRIAIYYSNASTDGRGTTTGFRVGGTNPSAPADSVGPEITLYFDRPGFRSGDVVSDDPVLYVSLKDSNGINSSTHSIGHRLEAWIDGSTKSVDLTEFYQGTVDSYKEGIAAYALEDLSPGSHSITVRAWDVYNNSSTAETYFVVASGDALSIQQLFNFPNPVTTVTAFTFQHNQLTPIDVTLQIYTVAGRLVHTIERPAVTERFVKIDWDRRDKDGDELGNGIYFYKVIARTIDGRYASEAVGKMAVMR